MRDRDSMGFDMLMGTTGNHISFLSVVREMTPVGRWKPVHQRMLGFLTSIEPSIVQLELISRYMDCLRPNSDQ